MIQHLAQYALETENNCTPLSLRARLKRYSAEVSLGSLVSSPSPNSEKLEFGKVTLISFDETIRRSLRATRAEWEVFLSALHRPPLASRHQDGFGLLATELPSTFLG